MVATRNDVDRWIKEAIKNKMKFIISVCDTFEWDDFPIYCKDEEELRNEYPKHDGENMETINEIIKIEGDKVTEGLDINQI